MPLTENPWSPGRGEILTVSDLIARSRTALESLFTDVWLEGEVQDLKIPASGHAYFTIADSRARLRAVCFRQTLRLLDEPLKTGAVMLFRGRLTVYEQRGDLQLLVEFAEGKGEGLLRLKLKALQKKLAAEGLFDQERKRPLPAMPSGVAVVTSPTGAAIHDIINVLRRRAPWVAVYLSPSRVQGEGAAAELLAAFRLAVERPEVETVIIGRGGGASDDLSAFNDEALVRAVAASPKPVISAVGHETDFTLTDFAADQRAPTPSAAAEMAVKESGRLLEKLKSVESALFGAAQRRVFQGRHRLLGVEITRHDPSLKLLRRRIEVDTAQETISKALEKAFSGAKARLSGADFSLAANPPEKVLAANALALSRAGEKAEALLLETFNEARNRLALAASRLEGHNPRGILGRGYAIARDSRGRVLKSSSQAWVGQEVRLTLGSGELGCEVKEVFPMESLEDILAYQQKSMVERQLVARGISDRRVLDAFLAVKRHDFVPAGQRQFAYDDSPLPIGDGQTISQPFMVALMTESLGDLSGRKVLEVGTGSGYQAAILAALGATVHTIERNSALADKARATLHRLGYANIQVYEGDGTLGLPGEAPFDAILVTAGGPLVPETLKRQLNPNGGVLVIPVGGRYVQQLTRVTRRGETYKTEDLGSCRFVPLLGEEGWN